MREPTLSSSRRRQPETVRKNAANLRRVFKHVAPLSLFIPLYGSQWCLAVASDTIVIHGARDETVPLANVLSWAEPLDLPVIVVPGADHFFHRRLHVIRDIVTRAWRH